METEPPVRRDFVDEFLFQADDLSLQFLGKLVAAQHAAKRAGEDKLVTHIQAQIDAMQQMIDNVGEAIHMHTKNTQDVIEISGRIIHFQGVSADAIARLREMFKDGSSILDASGPHPVTFTAAQVAIILGDHMPTLEEWRDTQQ